MNNTIENAEKYLSSCPISEAPAVSVFSYALAVNASLYDRIAELKKENTDLRRALSDCKAKARVGLNPDK